MAGGGHERDVRRGQAGRRPSPFPRPDARTRSPRPARGSHITADVPLFTRKLYYATGDLGFLNRSWPLTAGACEFWALRFILIY